MSRNFEMAEFLTEMARNEIASWNTYMLIHEEWKKKLKNF